MHEMATDGGKAMEGGQALGGGQRRGILKMNSPGRCTLNLFLAILSGRVAMVLSKSSS